MAKIPAIGIDFGTTSSCIAVYQHGKLEIITDDQGKRSTPNYVAFNDVERIVGEPAKYQAARNPKNTILDVKRLIGRKFVDPKTQDDMKRWPFTVINVNGQPKVQIKFKGETKEFDPAEIIAMILSKLVKFAEIQLDGKVNDVVITVPASFNDSQRQATKDAGAIAGLNVLRIINEPTAAALSYAFPKNIIDKRTILIFDLGGGTLDVSIVTIERGSIFEVISTAGNTNLGGNDFDNRFVDYFAAEFKSKHNVDLTGNARALTRLRVACERAKCELSLITETPIEIDSLYGGIDFFTKATRDTFENVNKDLFDSLIQPVNRAITDANLNKLLIDDIVLVGGSTRIPKIQMLLQDFFDDKTLNFTINPDEAVAYGAALQAEILIQSKKSQLKNRIINDVTPISLGIGIRDNNFIIPIFKCNDRIPLKNSWLYEGFCCSQTKEKFNLFEMLKHNLLGTYELTRISPLPKGEMNLEVEFQLNADGILHVSAKDISSTGQSNQTTITNDLGRLTKDEIDKMKLNAEKYHEEDERQRQNVMARHNFENYIVWCIKTIEEDSNKGKLSESEKQFYQKKCNSALDWLDRNTTSEKRHVEKYLHHIQQEFIPILTKLNVHPNLRQIDETSISRGSHVRHDDKTTQKTNLKLTISPEKSKRQSSKYHKTSVINDIDRSQMNPTNGNKRQTINKPYNFQETAVREKSKITTKEKKHLGRDQARPGDPSKIGSQKNQTLERNSYHAKPGTSSPNATKIIQNRDQHKTNSTTKEGDLCSIL